MASLRAIRTRIKSVRNTQKITKALKMVSAAKLRRAQERVISARPYATLLRQMLSNVVAAVILRVFLTETMRFRIALSDGMGAPRPDP